jgi:hypothetical protein
MQKKKRKFNELEYERNYHRDQEHILDVEELLLTVYHQVVFVLVMHMVMNVLD